MPSLHDDATRAVIRQRLHTLAPERTGAWGRMTAPQMLAHLTDALRLAFGDLPCVPKNVPLARVFPVKHLILYVLPFPKGAPTARELVARPPAEWPQELAACCEQLERFASASAPSHWPAHPLFGRLTGAQWGVLAYRHMDHHLRQFGV